MQVKFLSYLLTIESSGFHITVLLCSCSEERKAGGELQMCQHTGVESRTGLYTGGH